MNDVKDTPGRGGRPARVAPPDAARPNVAFPWHYRVAKRALDVAASLVGLTLAMPLMVGLAAWVRIDSPGPVLYRAARVGAGGEPFAMLKFRSMVRDADRMGGPTTSSDDDRLTRSGRFMRRAKLDELPQLAHVLTGRMSLVGPRPDVPTEVAKLTAEERATILAVRPGMTDWASLRYYDEGDIVRAHPDPHVAYEQFIRPGKVRLQTHYVRTASMATDLRIVAWTLAALVGRRPAVPDPGPSSAEETG